MREKIKPSILYFFVAGIIFISGVIVFILLLVNGLKTITSGGEQVLAPGTSTISLNETGNYTIFYEYESVLNGEVYSTSKSLNKFFCKVNKKSDGSDIALNNSTMKTTYTLGSRSGVSIFNFQVNEVGEYDLTGTYLEGIEGKKIVLFIKKSNVFKNISSIIISILVLLVSIGTSVGIMVVTIVKRQKCKKYHRSLNYEA